MSLSTIIHDISGISSSTFLLSMLQFDLSGNVGLLSTIIHDISGMTNPNMITSTILLDISGVSSQIFSINDLLMSHEVVTSKESTDRSAVMAFTSPSMEALKPNLYKWAASGFPGAFIINTLTLEPPSVCSDGISRSFLQYFEYLFGSTTQEWLQGLEAVTDGMSFTFSHNGFSSIMLHVTRS
jgi:hypothetical protein